MSRILPHPLLSAALTLTWLLLNAPPTPGNVLLALAVGLAVPAVMRALEPRPVRLRAPATIARLIGIVLYDMVRSNIDVARIILGPRKAERKTGYVTVPLELRAPAGLTVLAVILTATPGTLWVQYDSDTGHLLLHVLDFTEDGDWADRIKDRYERPLLEIFA
ncbi:MAG: Na+/H+ antiporter subunit E [Methylorubrum rhodinum]|uniref:Na+/H+ antiporter subunit E n=1 Tax=Methylorubrum rhodinum TaxID=29428 RepID=UPI003BAEBBBF